MYCCRKVTDDLIWVGANDRRLAMFEGVYSVPRGVSYNSYLLLDEKTVLFDTVDAAVGTVFFENVEYALGGRHLDYIVVHHMEPDHSATLSELVRRYPDVKIICNQKLAVMMKQYFTFDVDGRCMIVKEGDTFTSGAHTLTFVNAPMVHWPEVMMTYDTTGKVLFTADAFGTFGATNGALFADEVDFERDYLEEARRYYTNIVGKYGTQVTAVLKKASGLDIRYLAPLHGFVWRKNIADFVNIYQHWATYTPEETGVVIAYASVYHHTENAAECLAVRLREKGIPTYMFDVSVTPASEIISAVFRYSHLVLASTTYNAGIFVQMESFLYDLAAHNIQNRVVAIIENGSWAPTSGKLMREVLEKCKNMTVLGETMTIKSAMKEDQLTQLDAIADAIDATIEKKTEVTKVQTSSGSDKAASAETAYTPVMDTNAMFKLSYGLFVLTARDGDKDNGCIINTASQVTSEPNRITIAVNKNNYTHDMIRRTGTFNVSVLSQDVTFDTFRHFGFQSGRDTDKFADFRDAERSANGLLYVTKGANALISGRVIEEKEFETHTLFIAEVTECRVLSDEPSVTYAYYFEHIKPKPQPAAEKQTGWVCKICGYVYEGEELPADFICPLCKHPASDFEKMQ
ncbi:MAG: flavin reductase [Lachnospiraceae bacterium]|nr:flavin reductase [Lachnospiraceae bacterium]